MKNKAILLSAIIMGIFIFAGYDTDMKADPAPENTSISILNPQSYPTVGGNWTVFFNTTGKADLWITAVNGTEFNKDLTFFEVRCGDEILNYEWINNSILIRDYECSETGTETSKVLSAGKHHLEFRFGGDVEYAHNAVVFVRVGGDTDNSFSFDIGSPGTNRLVVVIADVEGAGTNLGGVTVDGKSCVLVARAENTVTGQNHQEMWYCDEDNLGASSGSVTVLLGAGSGATWGVHAHLYTGVSQSGPTDSGIDDTSTGTTVTVTGIDVPANGLVVMGAAEGTDALTVNSWTSPLIERQDGGTYDPDSADLASASGIETSAQTGKTYVATFSDDFNRGTGIVGVWPMANVVSWNQTTLNLGSGYKGAGRVNGSANITSVGTNTNVTVNCTSGNCSKITVSWSNSTNMTDGQSIQANFTCSDSAVGSFWANFSVKSVQDTTLAYINVSCTISSVVAWNQSTLNLTGYKGAGSVNGSANISSLGNNTNVTINCTAGSCSTISLISWSNSTNMTHNQNTRINFTCKDSTVGNFSANFSVKSVEDTTLAYINVSCNIAPGNVAWSQPNLSIGGPTTAGNATGYANIISNGNNTNVTVNCSTGNCTIILSNWTVANTTNQNYTVKFTCVNDTAGSFWAVFNVTSAEDTSPAQINVSCEIWVPVPTSLLAVKFNVPDFAFASDTYVGGVLQYFNSSIPSTNLVLMTSMNVKKETDDGVLNEVWVRIKVDDNVILEERLRSVDTIGDEGVAGTQAIGFNVIAGTHNITTEFKRTGTGVINITDFDMNLGQLISAHGNHVGGSLINESFTHNSTSFFPAFNWTLSKTIESGTFNSIKQTIQGTEAAMADYYFEDLTGNHTTPFWRRWLSNSSDVGSVVGTYIDEIEEGNFNYTIQSRTTAGTVTVNFTILEFDLKDNRSNFVNNFQLSNDLTNLTSNVTYEAGIHNIANKTVTVINGTGYFLTMSASFMSTTGNQTVTYFINSSEVPESNCYSKKERYMSSDLDTGNTFIYTVCDNLTPGSNYTFNLWVEVPAGENVTQLDESFNGFEIIPFDIASGNIAPLPNEIITPGNGSYQQTAGNVTWFAFTDINDNFDHYTVTLRNLDYTIIDNLGDTTNLSIPVDYSCYVEGTYIMMVEGCDTFNLCSNSTSTFTIIPLPQLTVDKNIGGFKNVDAEPGDYLNFTLVVKNTGMGVTYNVSLFDYLPQGFNYTGSWVVNSSGSYGIGAGNVTKTGDPDTGLNITWDMSWYRNGTLNPGENFTINYEIHILNIN